MMSSADCFSGQRFCFAGNAVYGAGGQGEFLRQMVYALDQLPQARIYSRQAKSERAECVNLPFTGFPLRAQFDLLSKTPWLRRRRGRLTLLSDLDFDRQVADKIEEAALFDGVMGQCCETFQKLARQRARLLLTCLNTHIDNLMETLKAEHERIGFKGAHPFHARMRERARREIELSDMIRVTSEWARQTFIERGVDAQKIRVIRPGVNLCHFHPTEKKDEVFRVMAVAAIEPRKGIHYLLQAFVEADLPNSELVIIGATGDRWSSRMLKSYLHRHGNIKTRALDIMKAPVAESFGAASVVVHPAIEDGYALVIPQAMAAGRPVIATRQSGASELIAHGENGFVVEGRSVKDLKDYLKLLAHDRDLLEALSRRAPRAVSQLGYDNFARHVLELYQTVLCDDEPSH